MGWSLKRSWRKVRKEVGRLGRRVRKEARRVDRKTSQVYRPVFDYTYGDKSFWETTRKSVADLAQEGRLKDKRLDRWSKLFNSGAVVAQFLPGIGQVAGLGLAGLSEAARVELGRRSMSMEYRKAYKQAKEIEKARKELERMRKGPSQEAIDAVRRGNRARDGERARGLQFMGFSRADPSDRLFRDDPPAAASRTGVGAVGVAVLAGLAVLTFAKE